MGETEYFSVTSIPITIQNDAPTGPCADLNPLQPQPQTSSPPSQNPFLAPGPAEQPVFFPQVLPSTSGPVLPLTLLGASGSTGRSSAGPAATLGAFSGAFTFTLGPSSIHWPLTITPPGMTVPIIIEPSGYTIPATITVSASVLDSQPGLATRTISEGGVGSGTVVVVVTPTFAPTPVTVVFATVDTVTTTNTGLGMTSVYTTVYVKCSCSAVQADSSVQRNIIYNNDRHDGHTDGWCGLQLCRISPH